MMKEAYERPCVDVELFDAADVITASGNAPVGFNPENPWELPVKP